MNDKTLKIIIPVLLFCSLAMVMVQHLIYITSCGIYTEGESFCFVFFGFDVNRVFIVDLVLYSNIIIQLLILIFYLYREM